MSLRSTNSPMGFLIPFNPLLFPFRGTCYSVSLSVLTACRCNAFSARILAHCPLMLLKFLNNGVEWIKAKPWPCYLSPINPEFPYQQNENTMHDLKSCSRNAAG